MVVCLTKKEQKIYDTLVKIGYISCKEDVDKLKEELETQKNIISTLQKANKELIEANKNIKKELKQASDAIRGAITNLQSNSIADAEKIMEEWFPKIHEIDDSYEGEEEIDVQ